MLLRLKRGLLCEGRTKMTLVTRLYISCGQKKTKGGALLVVKSTLVDDDSVAWQDCHIQQCKQERLTTLADTAAKNLDSRAIIPTPDSRAEYHSTRFFPARGS
jgi:hypothetical protein